MQISLKTLLKPKQINFLIDKYIYKKDKTSLSDLYGNVTLEFDVIKKLTIYERRQYNHALLRTQSLFDEPELIKRVWREFLDRETAKGKNTRMLSIETGVPMVIINSYF